MPESRDRLQRQDDVIAAYRPRRIIRVGDRNTGRGDSIVFILEEENEDRSVVTPIRGRGTEMVGSPGSVQVDRLASGRGRSIRVPRTGRTSPIIRRGSLSPLAGNVRGGAHRTNLPTWYPRRPLNDITSVVRAIERRHRWRAGEGLQTEGSLQDWIYQDLLSTPGAQHGHNNSMISPLPKPAKKHCSPALGKVPKILLNFSHQNDDDSAYLTPQKKLLNNIETVEKAVMEELQKLKKTPSAKKAEREKRVQTLMSMR